MNSPHLFDYEYKGPRYRYGLRNRPVAQCHLPRGWIIFSDKSHPNFRNFGTIDFPRELTKEEMDAWEIEFVCSELGVPA